MLSKTIQIITMITASLVVIDIAKCLSSLRNIINIININI